MLLLDSPKVDLIRTAHRDYHSHVSKAYDEVLYEVSDRVIAHGSLGKVDIGALLFWKRLRADTPWVAKLSAMSDAVVREITGRAVDAVQDPDMPTPEAAKQGRSALSPLPGFHRGDAFASALLVAAAPQRMAVYDTRAQSALNELGLELAATPGRYGRYMQLVEQLREEASPEGAAWTARDIDLALYWLGGKQG